MSDINKLYEELITHDLFNELSSFYKLFSDPTRLRVIFLLRKQRLSVQEIASVLKQNHSTISHQLSILKAKNVVKYIRDGKNIIYSLSDDHISSILDMGIEHIKEKI